MNLKSANPDKELDMFLWAAIVCFVLSILMASFLAVGVLPLAGRAFLLTFHKSIKKKYVIARYRAVLIVVSVAAILWMLTS